MHYAESEKYGSQIFAQNTLNFPQMSELPPQPQFFFFDKDLLMVFDKVNFSVRIFVLQNEVTYICINTSSLIH